MAEMIAATNAESESLAFEKALDEEEREFYAQDLLRMVPDGEPMWGCPEFEEAR